MVDYRPRWLIADQIGRFSTSSQKRGKVARIQVFIGFRLVFRILFRLAYYLQLLRIPQAGLVETIL